MTTPLEQAFPLNANWPAATVRSKLAEAMIGVFDTADLSGEDFSIQPYPAIAVYGPDGDLELYAYDVTDTTTADDGGITCIVVSGRRYIKRGEVVVRDAAISATTDAQPASPSLGDTYIVPAAPSGDDWASKAKTIAQYTARGWLFRQPFVGMMVYVEDEDAIYHYDSGGNWQKGMPIGAIADGSIPPKKLADPFVVFKVEDRRQFPPASPPSTGTTYLVASSPSGIFVGHVNEVARWNGAAYEFFAPSEGDIIVRKDDGSRQYSYRSGAWVVTVSPATITQSHYVDNTTSNTSSGALTNRLTSPPITAIPGQKIRVTVDCLAYVISGGSGSDVMSFGIRIDTTGSLAKVLWTYLGSGTGASAKTFSVAEIDAPDGNAHTYSFATMRTTGSAVVASGITARAIFEVINPS